MQLPEFISEYDKIKVGQGLLYTGHYDRGGEATAGQLLAKITLPPVHVPGCVWQLLSGTRTYVIFANSGTNCTIVLRRETDTLALVSWSGADLVDSYPVTATYAEELDQLPGGQVLDLVIESVDDNTTIADFQFQIAFLYMRVQPIQML